MTRYHCSCGNPITRYSQMCRECYEHRTVINESYISDAQLLARERRDARLAASVEAQKARDERLVKWFDDRKEQRLRRQAEADAREAARAEKRRQKAIDVAAKIAAKRLRNDETLSKARIVKMTIPANSPTHIPRAELTIAPPASASDPWAKIRARTNSKPPLMASNLRQLTPEELMIGRRRRA